MTTDEDVLARANEVLGNTPPPAIEPGADLPTGGRLERRIDPRRGLGVLVAAAVAAALVGGVIGRATAPDSAEPTVVQQTALPSPAPSIPESDVVIDGRLIGEIDGASEEDARGAVAWPGQPLTAPEPSVGEAVAWSWEVCNLTDDNTADSETCKPIGDSNHDTWPSPPVKADQAIRVVVDVDLGGEAIARAASPAVIALAWPDGVAPGEAVTTTTAPPPTTPPPPAPVEQPIG